MISPLIQGMISIYPKRTGLSHIATQVFFRVATGQCEGIVNERSAYFFAGALQRTLNLAERIDLSAKNHIPPHLYGILSSTDPTVFFSPGLQLIMHTAFIVDDEPPVVAEGGLTVEAGIRLLDYKNFVEREQKNGFNVYLFVPSVLEKINFPPL